MTRTPEAVRAELADLLNLVDHRRGRRHYDLELFERRILDLAREAQGFGGDTAVVATALLSSLGRA